jgi:hypothetical protein
MKNPLALIEFVVFIGGVIWLFTLPSSPVRRRSREDTSGDEDTEESGRG